MLGLNKFLKEAAVVMSNHQNYHDNLPLKVTIAIKVHSRPLNGRSKFQKMSNTGKPCPVRSINPWPHPRQIIKSITVIDLPKLPWLYQPLTFLIQ